MRCDVDTSMDSHSNKQAVKCLMKVPSDLLVACDTKFFDSILAAVSLLLRGRCLLRKLHLLLSLKALYKRYLFS